MTKIEKAREIIRQGGWCDGVGCDHDDDNECPCYKECENTNGTNEAHPDKIDACQRFLEMPVNPSPVKTLLDEFAMAAMAGLVVSAFKHLSEENAVGPVTEGAMSIMKDVGATAYLIAAAMMAERARRDEMGNIKEV